MKPLRQSLSRLAPPLAAALSLAGLVPAGAQTPETDETPVRPATVVPESAPPPSETPKAPAPRAEEVRPARPKVKSPEEELFDFCEDIFRRGDYTLALRQYGQYLQIHPAGKFREEARFKIAVCYYKNRSYEAGLVELDSYLRDFPVSRNRVVALFYAGESHLQIGSRLPAEEKADRMRLAGDAYRAVLQAGRTGTYAAYAAHRLAGMAYNDAAVNPGNAKADYREAARFFAISAAQMPKEQGKLKYLAMFFRARSQKYLGDLPAATASFEEIVKQKDDSDNEYYEKSLLELATLDMEAGREAAAMKRFEALAKESTQVLTRVQALVNSGMMREKDGKTDEAVTFFEQALNEKAAEAPNVQAQVETEQARARYGLVRAYFKREDWQKVVDTWRVMPSYLSLSDNLRGELLDCVGTAYSNLDQHARAVEVFRLLEEYVPGGEPAFKAGYKRLVSMFKGNDPAVPASAEEYVTKWREQFSQSEFLDKAWLVRAAYYFNRGVWEAAADAYQRVRTGKLEAEKLPTFLYQKGYAEAAHGDKAAVDTLSAFIDKAPDDERVPVAVLQRGLSRKNAQDLTGALADFQTIRDKYPQSAGMEVALCNSARVKGSKQDHAGMVADYEQLLKDFPQTKVAGEAHYWIGHGKYQLADYAGAIPELKEARKLNAKDYFTDATLMIIGAYTALEDVDNLIPEVDAQLRGTQEKKIPHSILSWLGKTLYQKRRNYSKASVYLAIVVTPDNPTATDPEMWATYGECLLESGHPGEAITVFQYSQDQEQRNPHRAKTYLFLSRAHLMLKQYEEATKAAEEGMNIEKESVVAAQLRMAAGDAANGAGRVREAMSHYNAVKVAWALPELTPLAIFKLAALLEKSGTSEEKTRAAELRKEIAANYPAFKPPAAP